MPQGTVIFWCYSWGGTVSYPPMKTLLPALLCVMAIVCDASEIVPLTALARRWRIEGGLYGSLRLATALFPEAGTEVVAEAMESLLTPGARRFLDRHVLPDRLRTSSGHVDGRAMQLWRKLWLTDGAGRRVSFCGLWAWRFALLSVRAPAAARGAKPR